VDPFDVYWSARRRGLRPALLESLGPRTPFSRRTLLGMEPVRVLELRDGRLLEDGRAVGGIAALFERLADGLGDGPFPAWVGFFAYEFARHLGLPTLPPMPGLPDAAFFLYPDGFLWEDGVLVRTPAAVDLPLEAAPSLPLATVTLESDYPADQFIAGVEAVQERIRAGWVYQVNLSHRFGFAAGRLDPLAFYQRLRSLNPSPFMGVLQGADWAVVSGSPERLFSYAGGTLTARPIAGTRPRGATLDEDERLEAELRGSRKEQAEHVMLVDLLRNDLSRVCRPGSVEVSEALTVERYSHVMHLVSEVRGACAAPLADAVAAIFPGGTITGAPKESVMREIARLEPVPRGAYTGSLGYVSGAGADFNILIRSLTLAGGRGYVSAGGGVVIESDPEEEYLETRHKAEAMLRALGGGRPGRPPAAPRFLRSWQPPRPPQCTPAVVTFVEAHDSFSYNIVNYLRMLGATVRVVDHAEAPRFGGATHVVVGPGPGDPASSGRLLDWTAAALDARLPFLGICLGHQALGVHLGATLARAPRPVHGEDHQVAHDGAGLFVGIPSPAPFTRYHSLCLVDPPAALRPTAFTADGVIMAVEHTSLPAWGVQFHPESMLSPHGLRLLSNFLTRPSPA
jgi:anthranilate synthase